MAGKRTYPGGFRLTLKTARELAVQEFGTARGLEPDRGTCLEGYFRMELGNLCISIHPDITGEIPIKGIGVSENIDFQFTNKIVLTGDERWGQSGAKILDNPGDWVDHVLTNGFANVDRAIFGKQAIRLLMADPEIQKRMDNRSFRIGEINPRDLPNGVRYYGHLNDPSLDLYGYGEVYLDDWTDPENPVTKPLVPDNGLVLAPSNPGFMLACPETGNKTHCACFGDGGAASRCRHGPGEYAG